MRFSDVGKSNAAVVDCKQIFGENRPYFIEQKVTGSTVIFTEHFIREVRGALSDGCLAKMNQSEVRLFEDFVNYQNKYSFRDISSGRDDIVLAELDAWLIREWLMQPQPYVNECFDAPDHTWLTN